MIKKITLLNFQTFNTDILSYDTPFIKKTPDLDKSGGPFLQMLGGQLPPLPPLDYATVNKFNFTKGNYNSLNNFFIDGIEKISCGSLDLNNIWESLVLCISNGCELFIPKYNNCNGINKIKKTNNIKLTSDVHKLINEKNKAWHKYMRTKNVVWLNEFKRLRNVAKKKIREEKEIFYLKLANSINTNPKLFWKHVNSKRKVKESIPDLKGVNIDGSVRWVNDNVGKANVLGKYFSSVYSTSNDECSYKPAINYKYPIYERMNDIEISEHLIICKLEKLNVYKSAGPDGVFPKILRECANSLGKFLYIIFSKSMVGKILPIEWKLSVIVAVYKKGDRHLPLNYRPISLTCAACKVLESIIKDSLVEHFNNNNLFHINQYGLMKGRSTSLQLLKLMDIWSEAVDDGNEIDVLYTDFEKAFDKVNHRKLLMKLNMYGVNNNVIEWIGEYLKNRKFQVRVNGEMSELFDVRSGVPQGSVLGPVLFVIYVNDIFELWDGAIDMYLYADDAKIFTVVKSIDDQYLFQQCMNKLIIWCDTWDIKLNIDKYNVIQYNFKGFEFEYKIGNCNLLKVDNINDLGVVFEDNFKFSMHIIKKVS